MVLGYWRELLDARASFKLSSWPVYGPLVVPRSVLLLLQVVLVGFPASFQPSDGIIEWSEGRNYPAQSRGLAMALVENRARVAVRLVLVDSGTSSYHGTSNSIVVDLGAETAILSELRLPGNTS